MKHHKLYGLILTSALGVSAVALAASGYGRLQQDIRISSGKLHASQFSGKRHDVPAAQKQSVVKRTVETEAPTLRGLVVSGYMPYICEFKGEEGLTIKNIFRDYDLPDGSGGAFYANGRYYVSSLDSPYMGKHETNMMIYDAETWDEIEERNGMLPSSSAYCATYDPMTDAVYGYFVNDEMESTWRMFGRMNLATGEVLGLNNVDTDEAILAIASSSDGYLYGVNATGMYCRITKNGEITKLGHTDIKPQYVQSAAIDPMTGKFYWAGFTDEGHGGLYVIDPETYLAALIQEFPGNEEIIGLYVVENVKEAEMPESVSDITIEFINDSHSGKVTFTAPDSYCDGAPIVGKLTAHAAVDGNHFEEAVEPGASLSIDVNVKYAGLYNIAVWVSDEKGASNKKYVQKWIGKDMPGGVRNLRSEVDGQKVILSWEAPEEGIHGGYVDQAGVTYIISRDGFENLYVRDYDKTVYEDVFPEGVSAEVKYSVRTSYNDYGGPFAYTDWIHVGPNVLTLPVELSANSDYKKFLVIDANGDGNTWETSWSGCAVYNGGSVTADDWMLTPEIQLEGGVVYQLEYEASAKMGLFSPEIIEVKCGQGDTPSDMTQSLDYQEISTIGLMSYTTFTVSFSVPVSGQYRFGFHALSDTGNQLGLAGISIKGLASTSAPEAPTALSLEAAPKGELKATVKCILPEKDSNGNALNAISKVELYNGDRLAATAAEAVPGAECVLSDDEAKQGVNSYSVVAYGEDGTKGVSASVSGWVGIDVPLTPTDLTLTETETGALMTWEISETGENGGYVDPEQVVYMILDPYYGTEYAVVKGVKEATISFEKPIKQTTVAFALLPMTSAGSPEDAAVSPSIIVGPGYELPIHEHFGPATDYGWTQVGASGDDLVGWAPEKDTIGKDGLLGLSAYYGEYHMDTQALVSGKISIPAGSDPTLTMWLLAKAAREDCGRFRILVSESFGGEYAPVYEKALNDPDADWETVSLSMKAFAGKDIFVALQAEPSGNGGVIVAVDNLAIREVKEHDAAVTNISIDTDEVEVGVKDGSVQVWIANQGNRMMKADEYTVDFFAGDRKFASVPGTEMEPLFGYSTYTAVYAPTTDDSDPCRIHAVVSYADDQDKTNNTSKDIEVYVVSPELPAATNLTAEETQEGVALNWDAADLSGKPVRTVTDDFEAYRTFDNNRAGDWTIIDEDQQPGVKVSYFFPSSSDAKGWVVMEPGAIPTGDGTLADRLPAYSGDKYMAAYCAGDNKDWLITPELSGNAQEITFMARAESVNAGREMFEVYYSTTGTELTDFLNIDGEVHRTESAGWSEFRFSVPEGAKYFAVRCVSHNRCVMHVDDFTYESAATPVEAEFLGYNIYRNGTLVNESPVATTTFLDASPEASSEYVVRAVYDRGEAPSSNVVTLDASGVDTVITDIDPLSTPVYDLRGIRVNTLTEGGVYVVNGRRFIYSRR